MAQDELRNADRRGPRGRRHLGNKIGILRSMLDGNEGQQQQVSELETELDSLKDKARSVAERVAEARELLEERENNDSPIADSEVQRMEGRVSKQQQQKLDLQNSMEKTRPRSRQQ